MAINYFSHQVCCVPSAKFANAVESDVPSARFANDVESDVYNL